LAPKSRYSELRVVAALAIAVVAVALVWDYYAYSAQVGTQTRLQGAIVTQTAQSALSEQAQAMGTAAAGELLKVNTQTTQTARDHVLARAGIILAEAETEAIDDPELGTLLAMESISTTLTAGEPPLPEAESFLRALITRPWPEVTFKVSPGYLARVFLSPDGHNNLLIAGSTDQVEIRNASNGVVWRTLRSLGAGAMAAAWSPDGRSVAGFGTSGRVVLWDVETGQPVTQTQGAPSLSPAIAFSPGGERVAISASNSDNVPSILEVSNLSGPRIALHGHMGRVNSVSWSRDGKEVLTASDDGTARVWDSSTGALRLTVPGVAAATGSAPVAQRWYRQSLARTAPLF